MWHGLTAIAPRSGDRGSSNTEIEAQFGDMNDFQIKDTDVSARGLLWQIGASGSSTMYLTLNGAGLGSK